MNVDVREVSCHVEVNVKVCTEIARATSPGNHPGRLQVWSQALSLHIEPLISIPSAGKIPQSCQGYFVTICNKMTGT